MSEEMTLEVIFIDFLKMHFNKNHIYPIIITFLEIDKKNLSPNSKYILRLIKIRCVFEVLQY